MSRDPLKEKPRSLERFDRLFAEAVHDLEVQKFSFTKEDMQVAFFEKTIPLGATAEDFNTLYRENLYRLFQPMGHLPHNLTENFTTKDNLEKAKKIDHILLDQMDFFLQQLHPGRSHKIHHGGKSKAEVQCRLGAVQRAERSHLFYPDEPGKIHCRRRDCRGREKPLH